MQTASLQVLSSLIAQLLCHLQTRSNFFITTSRSLQDFYPYLRAVWWFLNPTSPPGIRPVSHLFVSELTSGSVLVAWTAPAPPADLFILSYSSADRTDTSKVTLDGSKTRSQVQGLLPSTHYTISLITIQGDVTSEAITASLTTGEWFEYIRKVHVVKCL